MKHKKQYFLLLFAGSLVGVVNGLFGAGGGLIAVPLLKNCGFSQKPAHANSIAVILPLCIFSAILYSIRGSVFTNAVFILVPFGLIGALFGTWIMKKINERWLRLIFAGFMIYAGLRMLL